MSTAIAYTRMFYPGDDTLIYNVYTFLIKIVADAN